MGKLVKRAKSFFLRGPIGKIGADLIIKQNQGGGGIVFFTKENRKNR